MQLKLITQSFVLLGAGEGTAMVDADSVFHSTGFPYIPGRRIKGLLRESLIEVMEIYGEDDPSIKTTVASLFGYEDSNGSKSGLVFPNLYLENWNELIEALHSVSDNDRKDIFHPENIKRHFSTEIPQTAVVDGVAKDSSLRMYRVLKPELTFVAPFQKPVNEEAKRWLERAIANLRRAGTRRNKGFGSVKLKLEELPASLVADEASKSLNWGNRLQVRIKTISPVLLSQRDGEQNTVFTERHIAGTHLRGLLAEQVIRHKRLGEKAHQDDEFHLWILSGALTFSDCTLEGAKLFPLNLQQPKGKDSNEAFDAFEPREGKSKPIDGVGTIGTSKIQRVRTKTTFMFHNSRPNRTAGRSMDDDTSQGIFYYEALAEGQEFVGEINAENAKEIEGLVTLLGTRFTCQMGRSRSAQYGSVEVSFEPLAEENSLPKASLQHKYYLMVDSPLILLNAMGIAEADTTLLTKALASAGLNQTRVTNAITQTKWVEQYNAVWESKTNRVAAFGTGSVFELDSAEEDWAALSKITRLGEQQFLGFGRVRLFPKESFAHPFKVEEMSGSATKGTVVKEPTALVAIRTQHVQRTNRIQANNRAIKDASGRKIAVPNHLSSWILSKLASRRLDPSGWRKSWNDWLGELKSRNQKAYKTLEEFQLFEPLLALQPIGTHESTYAEDWGHPYWTTFFETLRKRNKKENQ